jgi:hypothetical protein
LQHDEPGTAVAAVGAFGDEALGLNGDGCTGAPLSPRSSQGCCAEVHAEPAAMARMSVGHFSEVPMTPQSRARQIRSSMAKFYIAGILVFTGLFGFLTLMAWFLARLQT